MKRSSKIIVGTLIGVGLVTVVTAKQFDYCERGHSYGNSHRGEWMSKRISHRLDLSDTQEIELANLKSSLFDRFDAVRVQRGAIQEDVLSLLDSEFDQQKAKQLIDQRIAAINENTPALISAFAGFYDQLDADQQAQIREMIERRMSRRGARWQKQSIEHEGGEHG